MNSHRFSLNKREKLKSRQRIEQVFQEGKSLSLFPFKVWWLLQPAAPQKAAAPSPVGPLQVGFGASSRHFKKAVDRNRIKRLGREAYRLQKHDLIRRLEAGGFCMAVFFIYTGKELPDHVTVSQKIGVILQKLVKEVS
ncbi:MAG TPA: ribonuclease P protein component [Puia sp.]|nr:ribonuclease P protein component [Puia sp.]